MITKKIFGSVGGNEVVSYTLDNGLGLSAEILNLGGIVRSLIFKGTDVVLGRDTAEDYWEDPTYFGALVGRNANRIEGAEFELNGEKYTLALNDNGINNLHGGKAGFTSKLWKCVKKDGIEPSISLSLFSPDGEEGFPGNANVKVTYTVTKENSLKIHYEADCDTDTVFNMTNHSYFNLNGHDSGDIKNHTLNLCCSFFTPGKDTCVPDGNVLSVEKTPFDFRISKTVGRDMENPSEQLRKFGGYDHNFAIDGFGFRKFAELTAESGIIMEAYTDRPAVQLYTGNYVDDKIPGKNGCAYQKHQGLCLETQAFPNSLKFSHFPTAILRSGEKYDTTTEYKFSIK